MLLVGEDTGRHQGCYGGVPDVTPNINRLAAEGCRYLNAFSTAPVCAPSRHTMASGQSAWTTGAHHHRSVLIAPPKTFMEELHEAGYHVNWANKTDFNFNAVSLIEKPHREWFDDLAQGSLPADQPWFLYHNFFETHESVMWKENWEERVAPQLDASERTSPEAVEVPPYLPDTKVVRTDIARYFDALRLQDREVGRALNALEASGRADSTIVIYLADHGRGLIREKRWLYPAGIHLPLIIRWPGQLQPGSTSEELVSWVDIAPTLLSIAGAPVPDRYQGRVFLGDVSTPPRQFCFAGRDRMDEAYDLVRCVRDEQYHYTQNAFPSLPYCQRNRYMEKQATSGELRRLHAEGRTTPAQALWMAKEKPAEELYDILADPHCLHNLAADPDYTTILDERRAALKQLQDQLGDLGQLPEQKLIDQGLVVDRLAEHYRAEIEPLPEELARGLPAPQLEMPGRSGPPPTAH